VSDGCYVWAKILHQELSILAIVSRVATVPMDGKANVGERIPRRDLSGSSRGELLKSESDFD